MNSISDVTAKLTRTYPTTIGSPDNREKLHTVSASQRDYPDSIRSRFKYGKWCEKPEIDCISLLIDASYMAIDGDFAEIACIFTRNDLDYRLFAWSQTHSPADFLLDDCVFIEISEKIAGKQR